MGNQIFHKNVPVVSPNRPFIAGHIAGNPNLPMIGVPLNSQTTDTVFCCRMCGEPILIIPSETDKKQIDKEFREKNFEAVCWIILGAIAVAVLVLIQL